MKGSTNQTVRCARRQTSTYGPCQCGNLLFKGDNQPKHLCPECRVIFIHQAGWTDGHSCRSCFDKQNLEAGAADEQKDEDPALLKKKMDDEAAAELLEKEYIYNLSIYHIL